MMIWLYIPDTEALRPSDKKRRLIHLYRFYINNTDDENHYLELGREFFPDDGFEVIPYSGASLEGLLPPKSYYVNRVMSSDRDAIKRELYETLHSITGVRPPWGTLTGVRPLKPALDIARAGSVEQMKKEMSERYLKRTGC